MYLKSLASSSVKQRSAKKTKVSRRNLLTHLVGPYTLMSLRQIVPSLQSTSFCAFVEIAMWLGQAHAGMFLTSVNVDRFIFYCWPRRYIAFTKKYVVAVCAFVIITSTG